MLQNNSEKKVMPVLPGTVFIISE